MQNFHSARKHLPPGWKMVSLNDPDREVTWVVYCLAYIEETALDAQVSRIGFGTNTMNQSVAEQPLTWMVCPSNGPVPNFVDTVTHPGWINARGNYAGNNGIG